MKNLKKSTKALMAFMFSLLLLSGTYGTALAQDGESGEAAPRMEMGSMMEMTQNCPMMKGQMQHEGMQRQGHDASQQSSSASAEKVNGVQVAKVTIGQNGYDPKQIEFEAGVPARLTFTRTMDGTCIKQTKIPAFGIKATDLPLNEPVTFEVTPKEDGTFTFACGMDMMKGTIVVKS